MKKWMMLFVGAIFFGALVAFSVESDPSVPRPRSAARKMVSKKPSVVPVECGVLVKKACVSPGYVLTAPRGLRSTYLIDADGNVVHEWKHAFRTAVAAYLLPNGNLLHTVVNGSGADRDVWLEELSWDSEPVWRFSMKGHGGQIHHDIERLPNGNTLVIASEKISHEECLAAGRDSANLPKDGLKVDAVFEVKPSGQSGGEIVWRWSAWDHLIQNQDEALPNFGNPAECPGRIDINQVRPGKPTLDWLHVNSVAYNAEYDEIMICSRSLSEVWVISRKTGKLIRRWGNPQVHGGGTAEDQQLFQHHDANWIGKGLPGAGNVLLFNNGVGRPEGDFSSVMEFRPGSAAPELVWEYPSAESDEKIYSRALSGAQRLPNGNTLICAGVGGTLIEVTSENGVVWKYVNPFVPTNGGKRYRASKNMLFRAVKYAPDYGAFSGRDFNEEGGQ